MTFSTSGNFLPETIDIPEQQKDLSPYLKTRLEEIIRLLNRKDTGTYDLAELQNNQQFFGANPQVKRFAFRKVFQFGAIAAGAVLNIAHGIVGITDITRFYANVLTVIPDYRPVPYSSITAVNQQIEINLNGPNIVISNGAASPNITRGTCIIEYIKN